MVVVVAIVGRCDQTGRAGLGIGDTRKIPDESSLEQENDYVDCVSTVSIIKYIAFTVLINLFDSDDRLD